MTRINCIPATELCDQHLLAEYRELPRVFKLARADAPNIPTAYTMGMGHVKFFYNKLGYLSKRQRSLCLELKRRGFKPQFNAADLDDVYKEAKALCWNDWQPTEDAVAINRARIQERLGTMKSVRFGGAHANT